MAGEDKRAQTTGGPGGGWVRRWLLPAVFWPSFLTSAAVLFWFLSLPWPMSLRWHDPPQTSFMEFRAREARKAEEALDLRHDWVSLGEMSSHLQSAVLLSEDDRFYQHGGIDWKALAEEVHYQGDTVFSWFRPRDQRALWGALGYYRAHRHEIKGRSTLTQQLAKNLFFTPRRSLFRKVSEAVVAKRLEWFLPKDRILELYLNLVEWGPGIFGAEAAAQVYFGVPARDLTRPQAAALAATLPHPLTSNPSYRPARMEWRREMLLRRMYGLEVGPIPDPPPLVEIDVGESGDTLGLPPPDTLGLPPPDTLGPPPPVESAGSPRMLPGQGRASSLTASLAPGYGSPRPG